ncbi:MAG: flagellar motor protein MotB [FCB group bacterium]|nr:flagellar motor protein MotB [FCB group bacterium]
MSNTAAMERISHRARRNWLLSYGDMITLLITFFIMLIIVRAGNASKIHSWVNQKISESGQELEQIIRDEGLAGITITRDTKGIHLILQAETMFDQGSAEPKPGLHPFLNVLGASIRNVSIFKLDRDPQNRSLLRELESAGYIWNTEVRIEGHTDDVPLLPGSDFRDNWELSAARAQSILKVLQKISGLPESRFAVAGYGEYHPLVENTSASNRAQNRRVEIIITASLVKTQ